MIKMVTRDFFGNPLDEQPDMAPSFTRNEVMRQLLLEIVDRYDKEYQVDEDIVLRGRVWLPPGRLAIEWSVRYNVHNDADIDLVYGFVKTIYLVLKENARLLWSKGILPYSLNVDFSGKNIRLELLVPSHWPELHRHVQMDMYDLLELLRAPSECIGVYKEQL